MPADPIRLVLRAFVIKPIGFLLRRALAAYVGAGRRGNVLLAHFAPPFHAKTAVCASASASNLSCEASPKCAV